MTQHERILKYIDENGSITSKEAIEYLGVARLSARIAELKSNGHNLKCEIVKGKNRFDEPTHWARYSRGE